MRQDCDETGLQRCTTNMEEASWLSKMPHSAGTIWTKEHKMECADRDWMPKCFSCSIALQLLDAKHGRAIRLVLSLFISLRHGTMNTERRVWSRSVASRLRVACQLVPSSSTKEVRVVSHVTICRRISRPSALPQGFSHVSHCCSTCLSLISAALFATVDRCHRLLAISANTPLCRPLLSTSTPEHELPEHELPALCRISWNCSPQS
ncbi:hypothetical protein BJ546DRAFT_61947 [Cryomyces antarcticus]